MIMVVELITQVKCQLLCYVDVYNLNNKCLTFSYTPCRDTAISPRAGVSLFSTPTPIALAPMLSYPTEYVAHGECM